jgi:hypothetical protein
VQIVFDGELWRWDARRADSWVFVSLPADALGSGARSPHTWLVTT